MSLILYKSPSPPLPPPDTDADNLLDDLCTTLKVGLSCECKMNIMSLEMILDYDCNEAIGSQEYDGKPLGLEVTGVDKDPIDLIG